MLRWSTVAGDARQTHPAGQVPADGAVPRPAAAGRDPGRVPHGRGSPAPTSTRPASGATGPCRRWSPRSTGWLRASEPFVYAYYDGLDKVAHEYGLGEHYDAELAWIDHTVDRLLAVLPRGRRSSSPPTTARSTWATTWSSCARGPGPVLDAVGRGPVPVAARPARPGCGAVRRGRAPRHEGDAWVVTRDAGGRPSGWFGPEVTEAALARLGDVALVARARRGLPRPAGHRAVRAGRPARLADLGRDARPAARRRPLTRGARGSASAAGRGRMAHLCRTPEQSPSANGAPARGRGRRSPPGRARRGRDGGPADRAERPADRGGRAAGQGHAHRLDDQAPARGGAAVRHRARRGQPRPPARDLRDVGERAVRGPVARPARRAGPAGPPVRRHGSAPSEAELRIAKAQLVGWLEGLFHGIQATLFAQQMAARQQLDDMRRRLPPGATRPGRRVRGPARHLPLTRRWVAARTPSVSRATARGSPT